MGQQSLRADVARSLNDMFWDHGVPAMVAVGLLLSIATHLRSLTGGLVGPGEALLSLAALLGWVAGRPWQLVKNPIVLFWGLMALTLVLGSQFGSLEGLDVVRNVKAYAFTSVITVGLFALLQRLSDVGLRRVLLYLCVSAAVALWIGFVIYLSNNPEIIRLSYLNDAWGDQRYGGWSENPNQLAFFFIPLPVWIAALWRDVASYSWIQRFGLSLLLIALMLMGLLVRSDGLFVVWVLEFFVLLFLRLRWDMKVSRLSLFGYALAMILCVMVVKTFAHGEVRKSFVCAQQTLSQGLNPWRAKCYVGAFEDQETLRIGYSDPVAKVELREDHWRNAFKALRLSPIVGHGPGAFAWMPGTPLNELGVGKANVEAHNTLLDLATQGGILLALGWCALLFYLLLGAWRVRDSYSFSVVLMIGMFGMFHYLIRQPYLWFVLIVAFEAIRRRLFASSMPS
jgi:O-Antigen ligase